MKRPNQFTIPVRKVKALVRSAQRPIVWGPATIMLIGGFFTWAYWAQPSWLKFDSPTADVSSYTTDPDALSPEDSAIAADIDTSSVLLKDLSPSSSTIPISPLNALSDPNSLNALDLLSDAQQQTANNANATRLPTGTPLGNPTTNPFAPYAKDYRLLNFDPNSGATAATTSTNQTGLTPEGIAAGIAPQSAPVPTSALQTALDQYNTQTVTPINGLGQSVVPVGSVPGVSPGSTSSGATAQSTLNTSAVQNNSFTSLMQESQGVDIVPNAIPISPTGSSSVQDLTGRSQYQNPNYSPTFSNPTGNSGASLQSQPMRSAPFTAPRAIGGGQINTFSNP